MNVAVVTGAGSGIGKEISVQLAGNGYEVILLGKTLNKLQKVQEEIKRSGGKAQAIACDLRDFEKLHKTADFLKSKFPEIDVLINSAGIIYLNDFLTGTLQELEEMFGTNLEGAFRLTQDLLPIISRNGAVIFVNSSAGLKTSKLNVLYSVTKHALKALADGLRENVKDSEMRVLSVYPVRTATPMGKYVFEFEKSEYKPETLLQPETIAKKILDWLQNPTDNTIDMKF